MNNLIRLLVLSLFIPVLTFAQGPWTQKASLPAYGRHRCFTFAVGNRGYLGCGWNGVTMYQDVWEYDPGSDTWMQRANYPGGPRLSAFGFSINNKGYVGCGLDQNLYGQSDFYAYDPSVNQWTMKASWIGTPIFGATATVVNGKGYVVCGDDWDPNYWRHNEMYRYDPSMNAWTYITNFPADGRRDPVGFAINGKIYVGTGSDNSYTECGDWFEYDPSTGVWTQKANFAGTPRSQACAFAVGNKGYMGTGGQLDVTDWWVYDPSVNLWQQSDDFPGQGRENAQTFVIGNKGYLVCGTSGVNYNDIWEFDPQFATGVEEKNNMVSVDVYPNPAVDQLNIRFNEKLTGECTCRILDNSGRLLRNVTLNAGNGTIQLPVNELSAGNYILEITSGSKRTVLRFSRI